MRADQRCHVNAWVADAVGQVPPERLVPAKPALLKATVAAIGSQDDHSEMRGYYVKLLASMVDRERQEEVHPAFPHLLEELSPLDALVLQITPFGTEVSLLTGLEKTHYCFSDGLLTTWETWKEGDVAVGRYRFFRQVGKLRPERVRELQLEAATKVQLEAMRKLRPEVITDRAFIGKSSDHAGFLELVLPQEPLFLDRGLAWHNLERLKLVSQIDAKDARGNLKEHFWNEPDALAHIKSLLVEDPFFVARMYYRTELGRSFAMCCVPAYAGGAKWHRLEQPAQSPGSE